MYVGALVGGLPCDGLHLGRPARVDFDLAAPGVEHGIAAEELLAHLLFHEHALLVELVAHEAVRGYGNEVRTAHDRWHVVGGNGAPVGDSGGAVLVAARVSAIGVALGVANEDGDVCLIDLLVHDDVVAIGGVAQVNEVVVVLGVVRGDLVGPDELVVEVHAKDLASLCVARAGVQAVGEQQQDVIVVDAVGKQLVEAGADGNTTMGRGLRAALHDVGNDDDSLGAGVGELGERIHADGVADALKRGFVEAVPVLGQALGILDRLAGNEDVRAVGQLGTELSGSVLEFEMHLCAFLFAKRSGRGRRSGRTPRGRSQSLPRSA